MIEAADGFLRWFQLGSGVFVDSHIGNNISGLQQLVWLLIYSAQQ